MITYKSVITAINKKLNTACPDIEISSIDMNEGIPRPCFRVNIDSINEKNFMGSCRDRDFKIRIYYFASSRSNNRIENLDMMETLSSIFTTNRLIPLDGGYVIDIIEDIEIDIVDGVLHFYIPVFISEDFVISDDAPMMEELEVGDMKIEL